MSFTNVAMLVLIDKQIKFLEACFKIEMPINIIANISKQALGLDYMIINFMLYMK